MSITKFFGALLLSLTLLGCHPAQPIRDCTPKLAPAVVHEEVLWREFSGLSLLESKKEHKIFLMFFTGKGCKSCAALKKDTFSEPRVVKVLNEEYVPILLDGDKYMVVLDNLGLEQIWPSIVLLHPNGVLMGSITGYVSPTVFGEFLEKLAKMEREDNEKEKSKPESSSSPDVDKSITIDL